MAETHYKVIYATNAHQLEEILNGVQNINYSIDKMCVSPWFSNRNNPTTDIHSLEFETDSIYVVLKRRSNESNSI